MIARGVIAVGGTTRGINKTLHFGVTRRHQHVQKTIDVLNTIPETAFEDADARTITIKAGPRELTFPALQYYSGYAIPNFFFHMTTAYNILRSNGVEIGKVDFLGA